MGTGASFAICQSLSSIEVRRCRNKIGPVPQKAFGVPLNHCTEEGTHHHIPLVVKHMVGYLEEFGLKHKGLFRISGSVTKVKSLKQKYDEGKEVNLVNEGDVNSVASLLKLFLNELPVAVFPNNLCYEIFTPFEDNINHIAECTRCLKRLLSSLPKAHYRLFHFLIRFLLKVASYSDVNHMTLENLAIIFGPTLFRIPCSPSGHEKQMLCNAILLCFLQHYEELFLDCPENQTLLSEGNDEPQHLCFTPLPQGLQEQMEEINLP
ncbi:protein FAM13A isoform X1 [Pogona vitticeps]